MRFAYSVRTILLASAISLTMAFAGAILASFESPAGALLLIIAMPTVTGLVTAIRHHAIDALSLTIIIWAFSAGFAVRLIMGDASGLAYGLGPMLIAALVGVFLGVFVRTHAGRR